MYPIGNKFSNSYPNALYTKDNGKDKKIKTRMTTSISSEAFVKNPEI